MLLRLAVVIVLMFLAACSSDGPTPPDGEEQARASAAGFLDAWVERDYDTMCALREPCKDTWTSAMELFPVPVRDPELGSVTRTDEGFRFAYQVQLPDHGSLCGAFMETSDADLYALLLDLTGAYVTWDDVLEMHEIDGEYRVVPLTGDEAEGSSRIPDFLWSLGLTDFIGFPGDDTGRLVHYWAIFAVGFGLDESELDPLIAAGLDQYDAYLERVADLDDPIP